eukprot:6191575-Pleurochrysis_carterae.AAC.1
MYTLSISWTASPCSSTHHPSFTISCPTLSIARHETRLSPPAWMWMLSPCAENIVGTPSGTASLRVAHATDASPVTCSSSHTSSCKDDGTSSSGCGPHKTARNGREDM